MIEPETDSSQAVPSYMEYGMGRPRVLGLQVLGQTFPSGTKDVGKGISPTLHFGKECGDGWGCYTYVVTEACRMAIRHAKELVT